jgi:hypothetical protein
LQHEEQESLMASDNHTTIVGNLVDDPELRFTSNGTPAAIQWMSPSAMVSALSCGMTFQGLCCQA